MSAGNVKKSGLPAAAALTGAELIDLVQGGANVRAALAALAAAPLSRRLAMAGDLTLTAADLPRQFLDPGGADRAVALPASGSFQVKNVGTADRLTVTGTGLADTALGPGDAAAFVFDGSSWQEV